MKKSSLAILVLVLLGFLFFAAGGVLIVIGSLMESDGAVMAGLLCLFAGIAFYIVMFVFLAVRFIHRKREIEK